MAYTGYGYPGMPNIQSGTSDITGVPWVSSIDEVRAAQIPFGYDRQIFFDHNNDIFYMKWSSGQIRAFSFSEIQLPSNNPMNFVSRQEFDDLRSKYEQLVQSIQHPTVGQSQPAESVPGASANEAVPGNTGAGQAAVLPNGTSDGNGSVANQQFANGYTEAG